MAPKTPPLGLLPYFVRAARLANFSAVAREFGVSAVAVSKAIASLENDLGVRLFHRSTRSVSLTEEGRTLLEQCEGPLEALSEGARAVTRRTESGLVRISCVPPFGKVVLIPMLRRFFRVHPDVKVDVVLEARNADFVREGYDLGIRAGSPPTGDVVSRKLADLAFVLCGSPEFFAQRGVPTTIEELQRLPCLRLGSHAAGDFTWKLGSPFDVRVKSSFASPDILALEVAALSGLGIMLAPLPLVLPHFRSGALRPVLPECLRGGLGLHVHYRSRKNMPARTRAVLDFLVEETRAHPDLQGDPLERCRPYWASPS
ncbi:MAG: LysR family transcriptional regulator [Polyangiaceae bacterium]